MMNVLSKQFTSITQKQNTKILDFFLLTNIISYFPVPLHTALISEDHIKRKKEIINLTFLQLVLKINE